LHSRRSHDIMVPRYLKVRVNEMKVLHVRVEEKHRAAISFYVC